MKPTSASFLRANESFLKAFIFVMAITADTTGESVAFASEPSAATPSAFTKCLPLRLPGIAEPATSYNAYVRQRCGNGHDLSGQRELNGAHVPDRADRDRQQKSKVSAPAD